MCHSEQREFVQRVSKQFPNLFAGKILEIGSLNINGTIRDFFLTEDYVGVDVAPGKGVDVVAQGQELTYPDNSFDVCVSSECFEHNPYWMETFENMVRMSSRLVVFTCASEGREEHGTTATTPQDSPFTLEWDYYRNLTEQDFRDALDIDSMFQEHSFEYNPHSCDLYFWGLLPVQ